MKNKFILKLGKKTYEYCFCFYLGKRKKNNKQTHWHVKTACAEFLSSKITIQIKSFILSSFYLCLWLQLPIPAW